MAQSCNVPRLLVALCAVLFAVTGLSVVAQGTASAAPAVDRRLGESSCALTGRLWVEGRGCARYHCVAGAAMFKGGRDAELCMLRGPRGAEFARPINARLCGDLGRVWIAPVNSCASNPDRARRVVSNALQCVRPGMTYLNHRESEGRYDECVGKRKLTKLQRIARGANASINAVAVDRSKANCAERGGWVMRSGVCVRREGPVPESQRGGMLMVGDSVSWRADDELRAMRRQWTFDLRPGRRLEQLPERLARFRANHGDPDRVIIQLGTNRRNGLRERQFRAAIASLPATTPVMLVLPYRHPAGVDPSLIKATVKQRRWMRALGSTRPLTCVADWPKVAAGNLGNLVDGAHPGARHERWYAQYVLRAWQTCTKQLGL